MEVREQSPMQRAGPLAGIPALLVQLNVLEDVAFAGSPIRPGDLFAENYLPFRDVLSLLAACARVSGRSDFGLLLGLRADHRSLGLVGAAMEHAETFGEAILDYVGVQVGLSQGAVGYVIPSGDCLAIGFGIHDRYQPGSNQVYGLAMAVAANTLRRLTGGQVEPLEVHFCHRAPDSAASYAKLLRATVLFSQAQSCVVIPAAAWKVRNPGANRAARQAALAELQRALRLDEIAVTMRLRHHLRPLITAGVPSRTAAAKQLGLHPRTLARRLATEGTTFERERDAVRCAMACELLAMTDLPIGEIAIALCYSTHAAFDEAFGRWNGTSPARWRKGQQAEPAMREP